MDRITTKQLLIAFLGILSLGTLGYSTIEKWSLLDSFFMTVITITTVGYREVGGPLSDEGKLFTVGIVFAGFGIAGIGLSYITSALLRGGNSITFGGNFACAKKLKSLRITISLPALVEQVRSLPNLFE